MRLLLLSFYVSQYAGPITTLFIKRSLFIFLGTYFALSMHFHFLEPAFNLRSIARDNRSGVLAMCSPLATQCKERQVGHYGYRNSCDIPS